MRRAIIPFAIALLLGTAIAAQAAAKTAIPHIKAAHEAVPTTESLAYVVIDRASGKELISQDADLPRPIASLAKMMTGLVVMDKKVPLTRVQLIAPGDKVGGSALNLKNGSKLTVSDLIYATFLASANDAANALAGSTKLTKKKFVAAMNAKAKSLHMLHTAFADPTGIDDNNISTPREIAKLAEAAFKQPTIRRAMLTAEKKLTVYPSKKKVTVKNSDGMLWKPEFDDVLISGGKTGYLGGDNGWNLAVGLRDAQNKNSPELMVVVMAAPMLKDAEADAEALARWAWANYEWKK